MRITNLILTAIFIALLLSSCVETTYTITRTEDAAGERQIIEKDERIEFVPEALLPEEGKETGNAAFDITLVEGEPQLIELGGQDHIITLLSAEEGAATIALDDQDILLQENEEYEKEDYTISLRESLPDSFARPKQSWVDVSFSSDWQGLRDDIYVGQTKEFSIGERSVTIMLDFIGLQDGEPVANLIIDDKSYFMAEDDEEFFDEGGYLRIRNVYFNDPLEKEMVDAARLRIISGE